MDSKQIDNIINEQFDALEKWLKRAVYEVITAEISACKQLIKEKISLNYNGGTNAETQQE